MTLIMEWVFIGLGSVSVIASSLVVLTGAIFPTMMLSPDRPFSNIVFFISLADLGGSLAYLFGFPDEGSTECIAQNIMLTFFFPASWMWTSALVMQLYHMLTYKRLFVRMYLCHIVCWSCAAFCTLIPLSGSPEYGTDDQRSGKALCTYRGKNTAAMWNLFNFFGLLVLNILFMSSLLISIVWRFHKLGDLAVLKEKLLFQSMRWYPVGLLVCWVIPLLGTLVEIAALNYLPRSDFRDEIEQACPILCGTVLALIFFANSASVRQQWYWLLYPIRSKPNRDSESDAAAVLRLSQQQMQQDALQRGSFICDDFEESAYGYDGNALTVTSNRRDGSESGGRNGDYYNDTNRISLSMSISDPAGSSREFGNFMTNSDATVSSGGGVFRESSSSSSIAYSHSSTTYNTMAGNNTLPIQASSSTTGFRVSVTAEPTSWTPTTTTNNNNTSLHQSNSSSNRSSKLKYLLNTNSNSNNDSNDSSGNIRPPSLFAPSTNNSPEKDEDAAL